MDTLSKIKSFSLILIGLLLIINVFVLNLMVVELRNRPVQQKTTYVNQAQPSQLPVLVEAEKDTSCPQSCISLINAIPKATTSPPVVQQTVTSAPKGEYFINLGTGSVLTSEASNANWKTIDAAQATFDTGNYGNIKSATLEVFLHVQSSGDVHARLFDSTSPAVFWTSDVSTNILTSTYKSTPITLSPGSKTYKVQMYSTLSTGYLDQARIHIVTQ